MFIEVCIISLGLHTGTELYKKIKNRINKAEDKENPWFKRLQKSADNADTACQKFFRKKIDPLFGDTRVQQLKLLSLDNGTSEQERAANRDLGIASVNMGLAIVSKVFYPPILIFFSLPTMLWFGVSYYKDAWRQLFKERRIGISLLNVVLVTWIVMARYFFAGSVAAFLLSLSQKLLVKTKDSSEKKLISVFSRHPRFVWILTDGTETEIAFEQLQAGDIVAVNAGEIIPVDGTITKGSALIGQQSLTGESVPSEKGCGEQVFASTILLSGKIHVLTEKAGPETTAAKIGEILNHTTKYKASLESKAEKVADSSILPTLGLGILAYPFAGSSGVLAVVFSCMGYGMRIIGPMSTLNFLRAASENNILVKDGRALEKLCKTDFVVFDKTGTLTLDQPCVEKIHSFNGSSEDVLLSYAAAAECRQTHPIAKAILAAAENRGLNLPEIENGDYEIGFGIKANFSGQILRLGSRRFMEAEDIPLPDAVVTLEKECGCHGYSLVMIAVDRELVGAIELHTGTRPEAERITESLRRQKIRTCIISGDQEQPTRALAWKLNVDEYFAGILPEQKAEIVEKLQREGRTVCFVGDGINDAIALKKADVSVSLRGASTAAVDAAQIVLMDGDLKSFTWFLDMSREFEAHQKTNLMISVIPNAVCTGGVFLFHFGLYMAMALYYAGVAFGIGNSMRPLITYNKSEPEIGESDL